MYSIVARVFGFDFIYFDLLFCFIWIGVLIKKKYWKELIFGLIGFLIVFSTDDILWFHIQHTRTISAPLQPDLFLLYFSFTYGMIEFSYVIIMFRLEDSPKTKILWTVFLYTGWLISAFMSQLIPLDNRQISIARDMTNARLSQIIMVIVGYGLLILLKYTWEPMHHLSYKRMAFLFLIGIIVHLGMELTLYSSGIRPFDGRWGVFIFDSLLEFNSGVPYLYVAWTFFTLRKKLTTQENTE